MLINGTAAHGEDFDDTFEGGPVHAGAVIVPAVLAACERHRLHGQAALIGIAVGVESICRLGLVAPKAVHKAGFHPTAIFGAMGAAAGVGAALGLDIRQIVDALGIAGSMAGGIIEYLAEGAWTKRLHAGWAAQSGIRAALLASQGFVGPRTVFEGVHGLFNGQNNQDQFNRAFELMMSLKEQAKAMMSGLPNAAVYTGPTFEYQQTNPAVTRASAAS